MYPPPYPVRSFLVSHLLLNCLPPFFFWQPSPWLVRDCSGCMHACYSNLVSRSSCLCQVGTTCMNLFPVWGPASPGVPATFHPHIPHGLRGGVLHPSTSRNSRSTHTPQHVNFFQIPASSIRERLSNKAIWAFKKVKGVKQTSRPSGRLHAESWGLAGQCHIMATCCKRPLALEGRLLWTFCYI